jgi:hypothetical protein
MEETNMRGRFPAGPECVEDCEGSVQAKRRVRVVFETMAGKYRVPEACRMLNICEQRFYQIRGQILRASVNAIEPKPAGRPRRQGESEEVMALRAQVAELKQELQAAQVREEIALVLPSRLQATDEPEKKRPLPPKG